jgi:WD40 repeat protein
VTTPDTFGRDLSRWLHEDAEHRVPDHLGEVLVRTAASRQRPWWSSPERWLPMDTVAVSRRFNLRPLALMLLVVGALVIAAAAALWVASQRQAPPFGLAQNGRIFVSDGQTLMSYSATGQNPRVELNVPAHAKSPAMSPDGTSLAYFMDSLARPRLDVLHLSDGSTSTIPTDGAIGIGGPFRWSLDGTRLLFNTFDGAREHLMIANADGTDVSEIDVTPIAALGAADQHVELAPVGWSGDGSLVAFIGDRVPDSGAGAPYVVKPDGSDPRAVGPEQVDTYSVSWSPDPAVQRLVMSVFDGNSASIQILDLATNKLTSAGPGFWPTWSPDGSRIAYWNDGTVVVNTADALGGTAREVRPYPAFTGACDEHADLAGAAFCGPAAWSPDGQRLLAPDITGASILSVEADGSGQPIVIQFESRPRDDEGSAAAWQPIRD